MHIDAISTTEIKWYLDNQEWDRKVYFGQIIIEELVEFFELFLDYPIKFSYQDILLFSNNSDFVVQISHHRTIWFICPEKEKLEMLAIKLDKRGCTVFPAKL